MEAFMLQFKHKEEMFATKSRLISTLGIKGREITDYIDIDLDHRRMCVVNVEQEVINHACRGYEVNLEPSEVTRDGLPDATTGTEERVRKEMQRQYDAHMTQLQSNLEKVSNENVEVYSMMAEMNERNEGLSVEKQGLLERISSLQSEVVSTSPLEDCKKLFTALRSDYDALESIGLTPVDFFNLSGADSKEEYLSERTGIHVPKNRKGVPKTFEETKTYEALAPLLDESREILGFVEGYEGKIPAAVLPSERIKKAKEVIGKYDAAKNEFEKERELEDKVEDLEPTYDVFQDVAQRVKYRQEKGDARIIANLSDLRSGDDLMVTLAFVGDKKDESPMCDYLKRYVAGAMDIPEGEIDNYVSYSSGRIMFSKKYPASDRVEVIGGIKKHLDENQLDQGFAPFGVGLRMIHTSDF